MKKLFLMILVIIPIFGNFKDIVREKLIVQDHVIFAECLGGVGFALMGFGIGLAVEGGCHYLGFSGKNSALIALGSFGVISFGICKACNKMYSWLDHEKADYLLYLTDPGKMA